MAFHAAAVAACRVPSTHNPFLCSEVLQVSLYVEELHTMSSSTKLITKEWRLSWLERGTKYERRKGFETEEQEYWKRKCWLGSRAVFKMAILV